MQGRVVMSERVICGWCPIELPDDNDEWHLHFLVEHRMNGYSVRFYPALTEEEEVLAIWKDSRG
jgi:hypothetical protein